MTTQRALLEEARRGRASAIAALMIQTLQSRGATVKVHRCEQVYHLNIVAEQCLEQQKTVAWVAQGFAKLNIPNVRRVLISGRLQNESQVLWQQNVDIFTLPRVCPSSQASFPLSALRDYCFVTNRSLLSYTLESPSSTVAQCVLSLAALTEQQQLEIAPRIAHLLQENAPDSEIGYSSEQQKIFSQHLLSLDSSSRRLAALWLSRYCAEPEATTKQLLQVMTANPDVSAAARLPLTEETFLPKSNVAADSFPGAARFVVAESNRISKTWKHGHPWDSWLFPVICSLYLFVFSGLAIGTADNNLGDNHLKPQHQCQKLGSFASRCFDKEPNHTFSSLEIASAVVRHEFPIFDAINKLPAHATEPAFPLKKALGIYDIFISFGANTLFTIVGLWLAMAISPCYACYSFKGIYRTASILGVVEAIAHEIPVFGFIAGFAIHLGAISLANVCVKDFRLDWTQGFKALIQGALVIFLVKIILVLLLYGAIAVLMI